MNIAILINIDLSAIVLMAAVVVMYSYAPNKHKIINHDNYCPEVVPQWPMRCQICMGKQDMLWKVQCTRNRTKLMEGRQKSNVSLPLKHHALGKKISEAIKKAMLGPYQAVGGQQGN